MPVVAERSGLLFGDGEEEEEEEEEFPCMKSAGLKPRASSWLMVVLMSSVASRLVLLDEEEVLLLPVGTNPWAASLLTTRLMSGKVRFCKGESRSGIARLEAALSESLEVTKPCWPSRARTSGTLGTSRFFMSGSGPARSRFEVAVVGLALGT